MSQELQDPLESLILLQKKWDARIRRAGMWCFYCGRSHEDGLKLFRCSCGFGESFGCGTEGRYTCEEDRTAHGVIAKHVREMLDAPRCLRSNSKRSKLYGILRRAASDTFGVHSPFNLALTEADTLYDSASEFRQHVLDAFRASRFVQFKELAAGIQRTMEEDFAWSLLCKRNRQIHLDTK